MRRLWHRIACWLGRPQTYKVSWYDQRTLMEADFCDHCGKRLNTRESSVNYRKVL